MNPLNSTLSALLAEELLSLAQAAHLLLGPPHVNTLWRWATRGVRGIRLRTVMVGGCRYIPSSMSEFTSRLSSAAESGSSQGSVPSIPRKALAAERA